MTRTPSLLALAALAPAADAFVMIDDFTVGGFRRELRQTESFTFDEVGLDTAHVAFGTRGSTIAINSNPNNATLTVDVGAGRQRLQSDAEVMWDHVVGWGNGVRTVDFSNETEFRVDLTTEEPAGAFADFWNLTVLDGDGRTAGNGGWLLRPEGIYFRRQAFAGTVDWSRIVRMRFDQRWNQRPNPLAYEVTRIYAVPEPSTLMLLAVATGAALRARKRGGPQAQ